MKFNNCLLIIIFTLSFRFSIAQNNKIILIGDTQRTLWFELLFREQNEEIRQLIFPQIAIENPSNIFILGDLTSWGASKYEWGYFDSITKPIKAKNIQIFPVIGNHDYFGNNKTALYNISSRFDDFKNYTWYCKEINSIGFVMLNSNLEELNNKERKLQVMFLDSILNYYQSSPSISKIVCMWHHPLYTNSTILSDDYKVKNEFIPTIYKFSKVKLIANGHCHSYEHFKYSGIHYLVSGGAGGPRQTLLSKNNSRHKDLFKGSEIRKFHYCILELVKNLLKIKVIAFDENTKQWILYDNWEIN